MITLSIILSSLFRLGIMVAAVVMLTQFRENFKPLERFGLSLGAGAGFLTIPAIWRMEPNPFEYWSVALFGAGIFLFISVQLQRHFRHQRVNRAQIEIARRHFEGREGL